MMASAPCSQKPYSFDSHGSGILNDEYLPNLLSRGSRSLNGDNSPPRSSSDSFLADYAVPIHPFDGDDGFSELGSAPSSSPPPPFQCSAPLSERHVFLCFKEPRSWPSFVEGADSDRLPRFLAAAIKSRKNEMMMRTLLIICEGRDGTDSSNGDVMIFPDMIRYRGLTHFDVDAFVDEVLVRNREWLPGRPERMLGTHVFVCAHGNHEVKLGVLGPAIIRRLLDQVASRGLGAAVTVKPCSYIGGYKYVRNLIVYSSNKQGEVLGHCYGSVMPDNVVTVLDDLCTKGHLPADVHMRLEDAENEQAYYLCAPSQSCCADTCTVGSGSGFNQEQDIDRVNGVMHTRLDGHLKAHVKGQDTSQPLKRRIYSSSKWWQASWWLCFWEKEDTLATLAIVGAAASVCLAYHLYKSHSRP